MFGRSRAKQALTVGLPFFAYKGRDLTRLEPGVRVAGNRPAKLFDQFGKFRAHVFFVHPAGMSMHPLTGMPTAPQFIEPMKLMPTAQLPRGPEWIYEIKWDGYRAVAVKGAKDVALFSRNHKSLAKDFPGVVAAVSSLPCKGAVLDGEVVAIDAEGRPSFQGLQRRGKGGQRMVYFAFDLLWLDGKDLCQTPLEARKARLARLLAGSAVGFSASLNGDPAEIAANAAKLEIEGIVAKRRDSTYMPGVRGHAWQKLKLDRGQDFVVGGYGPPGAKFDWLAIGYYDGDRLIYCGRVLNGFNPHVRRKIMANLSDLTSRSCPFANMPQSQRSRPADNVQWVKPQLVVRVNFTEWTTAGILRIPKFRGIREDVDPRDVRREVQER